MLLRKPLPVKLNTKRATATWRKIRTAVLSVCGFGLLSAAAWTVHVAAGLAVAGLSLLVLEWLSEDGETR